MLRVPVATQLNEHTLDKRALVAGVTINGAAKAYPLGALQRQNPITDTVGNTPLIIILDEDGKSIRAFDRRVEGREREFFLKPNSSPLRLVDDKGAEWDFSGASLASSPTSKPLTTNMSRVLCDESVAKVTWYETALVTLK